MVASLSFDSLRDLLFELALRMLLKMDQERRKAMTQEAVVQALKEEIAGLFAPVANTVSDDRLSCLAATINRNTPECFSVTEEQLGQYWTVYINAQRHGEVADLSHAFEDFGLSLGSFAVMMPMQYTTIQLPRWLGALTLQAQLNKIANCSL